MVNTKISNGPDDFKPLAILDRVCLVYGFNQKIQLANHFNMSASSLSNRYTRGNISYDLVVQCSLETGVNLKWLMTGKGERFPGEENHTTENSSALKLDRFTLSEDKLILDGHFFLDELAVSDLIPDVYCLDAEDCYYIVERTSSLTDGHKIVDIDGYISIREVQVLPGKQLRVHGGKEPFTCSASDIVILGHIAKVINELSV